MRWCRTGSSDDVELLTKRRPPTLCAGVALGLELTLEPTLCAGVAVGLDLMLVLDPNLDPALCAGVALGLDLTSEVCPKPGLYTVLWCRTGS